MPICISFDEIERFRAQDGQANLPLKDVLFLTPNARTQKAVIAGYMSTIKKDDVVVSPNILSIKQWLDNLWQSLSFKQILPKTIGDLELKFWLKETIKADENWQLTNGLGVAEKVLETYKNLSQWQLSIGDVPETDTVEQAYFIKWIFELEQFLQAKNFITSFQKLPWLLKHWDEVIGDISDSIILIGFNEITPIEKSFFDRCQLSNKSVDFYYPSQTQTNVSRIPCRDLKQEIEVAAALAKSWTDENPEQTIGVVVNQLSAQVDLVHQYFSDYFQSEELLPWQPLVKSRYNVSAGQPLAEMPAVSAAIKILQLNAAGLTLDELRFLKSSPFINWGEHRGEIGRFIHELTLHALPKYSIAYIQNKINEYESNDEGGVKSKESLALLSERISEIENRPSFSRQLTQWPNAWLHTLNAWGWCDAEKFQTNKLVNDFKEIFIELTNLVTVKDKYQSHEAFELFLQLIRQNAFQLPSDRTDVHILGMLEALGLTFERLIIIGFTRDNWPQKATISPFLPLALQREHNMPGSSGEREFAYAEDASKSLLKSAKEIFITEIEAKNEAQSNASIFFNHFPIAKLKLPDYLKTKAPLERAYSWVSDDSILMPRGKVKGGAYLLSNYASCPFKALSKHLLKLEASEEPQEGIDARIKGTWLHSAMELFWDDVKTHKSLLELNESKLKQKIETAVRSSHGALESRLYAGVPPEVVKIEFEKMMVLVSEWLEIEKQRSNFSAFTEVSKDLTLAGLDFSFKIDRLDVVENNQLEIIDYKTGKVNINKWTGLRPDEAQMPAYVIACENEAIKKGEPLKLKNLSYAKIKTGEVCRVGIEWDDGNAFFAYEQDAEGELKKKRFQPEFSEPSQTLIENWRIALEGLASNIAKGFMPVSPKSKNESCKHCEFHGFCRINENQPGDKSISITNPQSLDEELSQ